jgi:hypothetical protein
LALELKTAVLNVPVLNNTFLNYDSMDVLGITDVTEGHYQKLDDFAKWCISRSFKDLKIQDKHTLRVSKTYQTEPLFPIRDKVSKSLKKMD